LTSSSRHIDTSDDAAILIQVGDELIRYMKRNEVGYQDTAIDAVGLGAGALDYLRSKGYYINAFKSGAKPTAPDQYGNPMYDMLRSQRYWEAAKAMERGDLTIWRDVPNLEQLRRDLLSHNVEVTDKLVKVESKELIRKRLGKSPDFSDAVIMAFAQDDPPSEADILTGGTYDDWFASEDDE
jgi:hypothetical protein